MGETLKKKIPLREVKPTTVIAFCFFLINVILFIVYLIVFDKLVLTDISLEKSTVNFTLWDSCFPINSNERPYLMPFQVRVSEYYDYQENYTDSFTNVTELRNVSISVDCFHNYEDEGQSTIYYCGGDEAITDEILFAYPPAYLRNPQFESRPDVNITVDVMRNFTVAKSFNFTLYGFSEGGLYQKPSSLINKKISLVTWMIGLMTPQNKQYSRPITEQKSKIFETYEEYMRVKFAQKDNPYADLFSGMPDFQPPENPDDVLFKKQREILMKDFLSGPYYSAIRFSCTKQRTELELEFVLRISGYLFVSDLILTTFLFLIMSSRFATKKPRERKSYWIEMDKKHHEDGHTTTEPTSEKHKSEPKTEEHPKNEKHESGSKEEKHKSESKEEEEPEKRSSKIEVV